MRESLGFGVGGVRTVLYGLGVSLDPLDLG